MNANLIKIAVIALSITIICWMFYSFGANSVQVKWNQERSELNKATAKALSELISNQSKLEKSLEDEKSKSDAVKVEVRTETVEVEKEVIKYVTKYRDSVCVADDDWLRIYARSVDRTKAIANGSK